MDTSALDDAYRRLLDVAESFHDTGSLPEADRSTVDWTLAHIALSDRILAATADAVRAGTPPVVDNRDAMDDATVTALIASTTHDQRVTLVRRNAAELAAATARIPDHLADTPVLVRLVGRDQRPVPEQRLAWRELILLRAGHHVPGHTARLAALVPPA